VAAQGEGCAVSRPSVATRVVGHVFERDVGGLTGEKGRAAAAMQTFLAFSVLLSLSYVTYYVLHPGGGFGPLIAFTGACAAAYVLVILAVRHGYQLAASLIGLTVGTVQIVWVVHELGWGSGLHLYLIVAGQLVYMIFTEAQRVFRWLFLFVAAGAFVTCQVAFPATGSRYPIDNTDLNWMFSINAVVALALLFILATVAQLRARESRGAEALSARRAESLANTDALTGLANRRPILQRLEQLSSRSVGNYCVAIADLDRFKDLNDAYGHACGDVVLATVADRLRMQARITDALGRWGGEEFIFVMSEIAVDDAVVTMDRMRAAVGQELIPCDGHEHHVTMSVGVAHANGRARAHLVVKDADDALYAAKFDGRDRVRSHRGAALPMRVMSAPTDLADGDGVTPRGTLG